MQLKYGKGVVELELPPDNLLGVLQMENKPVEPLDDIFKESIMNPIGRPRLKKLLHQNKPGDVVVLVSDKKRSITDYPRILEFIAAEIIDAGIDEKNIEFIVALGTHEPHSPEDNRRLYGGITADFNFVNHDCRGELVSVGKTGTGLEVLVNRRARQADFVIATGKINFHYLAGFSGGRKSILPGIAGYETIRENHSKLREDNILPGNMENNIIAREMAEAAHLFGIDYIFNVVETPDRSTARVFCGDMKYAFKEGVEFFLTQRRSFIDQKADCVITSPGGYPADGNFFLSHKVVNNSLNAAKKGGAFILVAQCQDGFGNEKFLDYMLNNDIDGLLNYPRERIEIGGHRAFVTAKILKEHRIYVLSELEPEILKRMGFIPLNDINQGINEIKKKSGDDFKAYVIPNGNAVLPVLKE
ncbi:MAG TPA: nickel-dependent lactate racemase [candidate division WOR-3 bacterium]|uniref:Nickel-dependent lactate racemase n=1 Tax=candidate division WOR-3 bacterium TaxID=2052148 RepID=A0A9C9ELE4_UNCW3|nr:nickel-dependent lactate racemase [candidate division WOR-3 bacterium]